MGWDGIFIDHKATVKDYKAVAEREYNWERDTMRVSIKDMAFKNGALYLALAVDEKENGVVVNSYVTASVLLCKCRKAYCGNYEMLTKAIDENSGPFYYNCPARILNQLTPTDDEDANTWRKLCRDRAASTESAVGKLPMGTLFTVDSFPGYIYEVCMWHGKRSYIDWNARRRVSAKLANWGGIKVITPDSRKNTDPNRPVCS